MILLAGLHVVIGARFGEDFSVAKIVRETKSLLYVHDKTMERRVGKSRAIFTGDEMSCLLVMQRLKTAAGMYQADMAKARREYAGRKDAILLMGGLTK